MASPEKPPPLSLRELFGSIFAAILGVQSERNRERDFTRGSARAYVLAGIVATVLFVLLVYLGVQLILKFATGA